MGDRRGVGHFRLRRKCESRDAAETLERDVFFDRLAARYRELRVDSDAWSEIQAERDAESAALRDESER